MEESKNKEKTSSLIKDYVWGILILIVPLIIIYLMIKL
jgi:hypothetical protein